MKIQAKPGYPNPAIPKAKEDQICDICYVTMEEATELTRFAVKYDNMDGYDSNPSDKQMDIDWMFKGKEVIPRGQLDANGNPMASATVMPDKTIKGHIEYVDDFKVFPTNMDIEITNSNGEVTTIKQNTVVTYDTVGGKKQENDIYEYKNKDLDLKYTEYDDGSLDITLNDSYLDNLPPEA